MKLVTTILHSKVSLVLRLDSSKSLAEAQSFLFGKILIYFWTYLEFPHNIRKKNLVLKIFKQKTN